MLREKFAMWRHGHVKVSCEFDRVPIKSTNKRFCADQTQQFCMVLHEKSERILIVIANSKPIVYQR